MKYLLLITVLVIALSSAVLAARGREHLSSGTTNYQTEDGNERHEEIEADGSLKGHYSYIDPNGKKVQVNYVAGKDGFKATGEHFAEFNLGKTNLKNGHPSSDDSQAHASYHLHRKIPSYQTHKEISSYTPSSQEHESPSYSTHQETPTYTQTRFESPVIRHEIQRPKPRPDVHYRPEPVLHYKPEIHESYESIGNSHGGKNEQAVSYVNQENLETNKHNANDDDDDEDDEEENSYDAHSYSTYRPPTSKSYFTTKAPTYQPTFKPYYHEEEPTIDHNPVTTKFTIKHPVEKYSISAGNQHRFAPQSLPIPENSHYDKPNFQSGDDLTSFDTTKLLSDYHNNKPSISQLPQFPTTKFTIEDVAAPNHEHSSAPKPTNVPEFTFEDFKSEKIPEYTFNDFKSDKSPEYTFNDFKSDKAPEHTFNDFKSDKAPEYTFNYFKSDKAPEYTFNDFKTQNAPEFNDFKSDNFKQPDFSNFFKTEPSFTANDFPKGKPQEEDVGQLQQFLNGKTPANLGQYQQYLKSTEDEKIEQQYVQDQLKFQQQQNKQRTRPATYSRPNLNSHHPGRRPPKRPTTSQGLGTFRTTFKIPYGFHV